MIKELYSPELLEEMLSKRNKAIWLSIISLSAAVIVCVADSFFVNDGNAVFLEILNIILCAAGGWSAIYIFFNCILPLNARGRYIELLLSADRKTVCGTVVKSDKNVTVSKYVTVFEVVVEDDGCEYILYWDDKAALPDFDGKTYEFQVVQNKIVAYGAVE